MCVEMRFIQLFDQNVAFLIIFTHIQVLIKKDCVKLE